jgi:hypothetical protein
LSDPPPIGSSAPEMSMSYEEVMVNRAAALLTPPIVTRTG